MLNPSELRCPYWATPHPKWATRPIHRSFADPSDEIYRENPAKCPETKCFSSGPNSGCQGRISFHCTTEALIYNIPRSSPHPSHPCELCCGSGMFIPDLGSRFLPIPDPGSKNSNKREGWKISCLTFFRRHKFHKIENYFIFEMLKKKIWANFQRILGLFTQNIVIKLSKIWVWNPRSRILKKPISDPGSRGQNATGSLIRIRNTSCKLFGTLKYNAPSPPPPRPAHRSFARPSGEKCKEKPRKNHSMGPRVTPTGPERLKNIMSPAIAAALILPEI